MARTYQTLSLSLHPDACIQLDARGRKIGKTAARVAAEIVIGELAMHPLGADDRDDALVVDGEFCDCLVLRSEGARSMPALGRERVHLAQATSLRAPLSGLGCEIRIGGEWVRVRAAADRLSLAWRRCLRARDEARPIDQE